MAPNGQYADRSARFLARVDDHLPRLVDDAARRAFIEAQIEGWERRYARFIATEGGSEVADPGDPPAAADFLLTITGLASRRAALRLPPLPSPAGGGGLGRGARRSLERPRGFPPSSAAIWPRRSRRRLNGWPATTSPCSGSGDAG
jgi:hypothetical protein